MANAGLGGVQGSMIENMPKVGGGLQLGGTDQFGSQQGLRNPLSDLEIRAMEQGGLGWGNSSQPAPTYCLST